MNKSVVIIFLSAAGFSLTIDAGAEASNLNESNFIQNNESISIVSESVKYEVISSFESIIQPRVFICNHNGICR